MALLFASDVDREAARATLAQVLGSTEGERVALACLKLAGSDPAALQNCVNAALTDYRDILAWAESPRQMRVGPTAPAEVQARARREDAEEYKAWLRDSPGS
jgi:hypothetical protein